MESVDYVRSGSCSRTNSYKTGTSMCISTNSHSLIEDHVSSAIGSTNDNRSIANITRYIPYDNSILSDTQLSFFIHVTLLFLCWPDNKAHRRLRSEAE